MRKTIPDLSTRAGILLLAPTLALTVASCSTRQAAVAGGGLGIDLVGAGIFAAGLYSETRMFQQHWEMLNEGVAESALDVTDENRRRLEQDLNGLGEKIADEICNLEASNELLRVARYHQNLRQFPGFRVVVTPIDEPQVRAVQNEKRPKIEISLGLLHRHLNSASERIWEEKEKVRMEWSSKLSGKELDNEVTARASIPGTLEYKEALLFLVAHEAVHIWLDPPDTSDDTMRREQEIRADSLGLTIVSNISYIVDVRRKNEGLEAAILNWQSGSPRSIQRAVLYARSGPEYLFDVNQAIFSNPSAIYRTGVERQTDAGAYMKRAVYGNLKTPNDSYVFYMLNRIGAGH